MNGRLHGDFSLDGRGRGDACSTATGGFQPKGDGGWEKLLRRQIARKLMDKASAGVQ